MASTPGAAKPRSVARVGDLELGRSKRRGRVRRESRKGRRPLSRKRKGAFSVVGRVRRLGEALRKAETEGLPYEVNEQGPNAKHAPKPENRKRVIDTYAAAAIRL